MTAAAALFSCQIIRNTQDTAEADVPPIADTETYAPVPDYGSISASDRDDGKTVICLDPGHGFRDVGCQSPYGFDEKDITLALTMKLKDQLEALGAEVILTHDGNEYPTADKIMSEADRLGIKYKADKMNENGVFDAYERSVWTNILDARQPIDLFVSIHVNSITDHPEINGFSIDYYESNPSVGFLRSLSGGLKKMLRGEFDREARIYEDSYEEAYVVTKYTNVPSILVETGYATNGEDAENLQNESWQNRFAESFAEKLTEYIGS